MTRRMAEVMSPASKVTLAAPAVLRARTGGEKIHAEEEGRGDTVKISLIRAGSA